MRLPAGIQWAEFVPCFEVEMDQGRILILGRSKESSYEIRNILDNHRFEIEIALNKDVGKLVLTTRRMNLLVMHTEMVGPESADFFEFLEEQGIAIPILLVGEEAVRLREEVLGQDSVQCFEKPYPVDRMLTYIKDL